MKTSINLNVSVVFVLNILITWGYGMRLHVQSC